MSTQRVMDVCGALSSEDDTTLLELWREGDQAAGASLFDRYYETVVRFVHSKVRDDAQAEELVQAIFVAFVEGRDRFRAQAKFSTYVYSVAYYTLVDHYRKRQREPAIDTSITSLAELCDSPSAVVAARQEREGLTRALHSIPIECQVALELYYWEDLKGAEIAAVLGIPEGTVRFRLRRGKQLLARKLAAADLKAMLARRGNGD